MKSLKGAVCVVLCLGLMCLSQSASAQFKHRWQTEMTVGIALPSQHDYYLKEGYPSVSAVGNLGLGLRVQGQLMRHLSSWSLAGVGAEHTQFSSMKIPDGEKIKSFDLSSSSLTLNGRVYPVGTGHRITPYLQASVSYGQVSVEHGKFTYSVDSLSRHAGDSDHPMLLHIQFSMPEASQKSSVYGAGAVAGAEVLLNDGVGLTWQAGYHLRRTEKMELLQENLTYWDFKFGVFLRMFKTKRFY